MSAGGACCRRERERRQWEEQESTLLKQEEEKQQRRAARQNAVRELSGQTQVRVIYHSAECRLLRAGKRVTGRSLHSSVKA